MIDRQLYLVVAPAGYGKTTLLVDFASDSDIPVCWYALGPADAEPAVFLDYLVAAIQARFPRFGADTRRVMAQANLRTDAMAVVAALVNEVQQRIPDYFAVVLDDYHEVNHNPAINQLLDALLKHAPENFKLIVSSRTMPKLQLSRLAALRQAAGVGAKDLRFTAGEVRDLMRDAYQTVLPDRVLEELTARSEGWITGIILTTHTMWQGLFESMIRNSGQEQLYGYLAGEVFERQTPMVQRFLLASSILDDMEPAVAGPLAGVSRADTVLRQLEEANLFVSELEGRKRVYRYHHLFRDFLRARLEQGAHGLARRELERSAGLLYQQRGDHEQAVSHLLAAAAFDDAAASILDIAGDVFQRGRLETLAGWIDRLPEDLRASQPRLTLWRAQVAIQRGELELGRKQCELVEAAARAGGDTALEAEARVHHAAALRLLGLTDEAMALCRQALDVFGGEISGRRALALRTLGTGYWRQGALDVARESYLASLALYDELGDVASAAYVQNDLGVVAIFDGRLAEARQHLTRSAALMERTGNAGRWGLTLSNLGIIAYFEEDYAEATALFKRAIEKGEAGLFPHTVVVAGTSLGDVYRDTGRFEEAQRCYDAALGPAEELVDRAELLSLLWSMAESYRLQGLHSKAQVLLRRIERQASGYRLAQAQLVHGICALEQGHDTRARRLLASALEAFQAGRYRYQAARTLFHQAHLELRSRRVPESDALLSQALDILQDLGYAQFLAVDGPRCAEFVQQAAARDVGGGYLSGRGATAAQPAQRAPAEALARIREPAPELAVRVLGPFEVALNGRAVSPREWGSQSARELFVYLLTHGGRASKDRLMAALAPDASPARASSQFHVAAYRLRRALYHGCIRFDGDSYQIDPALHVDCDVDRFRGAMARASAARPGSSGEVEALAEAIAQYRGGFLEGSYSEWVLAEQQTFEDDFLRACTRLASAQLSRGDPRAAVAAAEQGLASDNSLEELHEIVLRALLQDGRRADAARHLDRYGEYLRKELGAQVPRELRELMAAGGRPRVLASR